MLGIDEVDNRITMISAILRAALSTYNGGKVELNTKTDDGLKVTVTISSDD